MDDVLPGNLEVSSVLPSDFGDYRVDDEGAMQALAIAEDSHFWHESRNALIVSRLRALGAHEPDAIVELGCGGGVVAAALAKSGFKVTGVDGHLVRLRHAARRAPGARFLAHDLSQGNGPLPPASFKAACLFDVIEHLERPIEALDNALQLVGRGGLVVGTVPALNALWSPVDDASGHKRRYSRSTLGAELAAVEGASVVEIRDFNRHLVPLMWVQSRRFSKRQNADGLLEEKLAVPAAPVNALFKVIAAVEQWSAPVLERTGVPGASLWFALRKS